MFYPPWYKEILSLDTNGDLVSPFRYHLAPFEHQIMHHCCINEKPILQCISFYKQHQKRKAVDLFVYNRPYKMQVQFTLYYFDICRLYLNNYLSLDFSSSVFVPSNHCTFVNGLNTGLFLTINKFFQFSYNHYWDPHIPNYYNSLKNMGVVVPKISKIEYVKPSETQLEHLVIL